ncbi:uncharacterized protein [Argopecten irradians]
MAVYQFKCSLVEMSVKEFYLHYKDSLPKLIMITQGYCGEVVLDTFDREQVLRIHTYSIQKRVIAKICDGCRLPGVEGSHLSIPINYDAKFCVIKPGHKGKAKEETLQDIVNKHHFPVDVELGKSGDGTLKIAETDKSTRQTGGKAFRISLLDTHEELYLLGNAVAGTSIHGKVTVVPVYLPDLRLSIITGFTSQPQERFDTIWRNMEQLVARNVKFDNITGNEDIAVYSGYTTSQDIYHYASPVEYCHIDDGVEKGRKSKRGLYTDLIPSKDNVYDFIPHDFKADESVYNMPDPTKMSPESPVKVLPAPKPKPKPPVPAPKPQVEPPVPEPKPSQPFPNSEPLPDYEKNPPPVPDRANSLRRSKSGKTNIEELSIDELCDWLVKLKLEKYKEVFKDKLIDGAILRELDKTDLIDELGLTKIEAIRLMKFASDGHVPQMRNT